MAHADRLHGGLVFFDKQTDGLDRFCRVAASTLEDYGFKVDRQRILQNGEARITSSAYALKLSFAALSNGRRRWGPSRLELTLVPADPRRTDEKKSQLVLLVMLYRIVEAYSARSVEWLDPATVLPAGQFMSAFSKVSPRRVHGRHETHDDKDVSLEPVHETEQTPVIHWQKAPENAPETAPRSDDQGVLALAFRDAQEGEPSDACEPVQEAESDIRRLAIWGMTGVVACLSGPVGLSMAAVNLAKGEDFRLNTHVLSLTGLIVGVSSSSAMADMVAMLPL